MTDTPNKIKKSKYTRSFKVTWGGRPYKSKKQDSFVKQMPHVKVVDGVCVLNRSSKPSKRVSSGKKTEQRSRSDLYDTAGLVGSRTSDLVVSESSYDGVGGGSLDCGVKGIESEGITVESGGISVENTPNSAETTAVIPSEQRAVASGDMRGVSSARFSTDNAVFELNNAELAVNKTIINENHTELAVNNTDILKNHTILTKNHTEFTKNHTETTENYTEITKNHTLFTKNHTEITEITGNHTEITGNHTELAENHTDYPDFLRHHTSKVILSPFSQPETPGFDFINHEHGNGNSPFAPFTGIMSGLDDLGDTTPKMAAKPEEPDLNDENAPVLSLDESVFHSESSDLFVSDLNLITLSLKTSFDYVQFFIHQSGTMFTPVSGTGHLYRNTNPFLTILPSIAFRDNLTFRIVEEFAKIAIATNTLRNNRVISANPSTVSSSDSYSFTETSNSVSLVQDMNIENYMAEDYPDENVWEFLDERMVLKQYRETYNHFELKSLKAAAEIFADYQLKKGNIDSTRVTNGVANLLLLLMYNSYFGKHNKNVNLMLGTCRELLSIFNKDAVDGKIRITSEHYGKKEDKYLANANFFSLNDVKRAVFSKLDREIQFLANWTNYNDLLTSMTILPETSGHIRAVNEFPKVNYSYIVDDKDTGMDDLKDIEYFSGIDLNVMKYINELTRLLTVKNQLPNPDGDSHFISECERLSNNIELYISQSERERDFMIYETTNNHLLGRTSHEIKEYQQLRTVNKVFALISILQVQRRLLGKLTHDEKVKSILFELIVLLDEKVSRSSAQAQCLFGSIFIIGCELGNLCNDGLDQKHWSAVLTRGKSIVMSHFDALVDRGVMAAERAKEIIHHIWITNSLNTSHKDWWVILKENKINIHLSL